MWGIILIVNYLNYETIIATLLQYFLSYTVKKNIYNFTIKFIGTKMPWN